MMVCRAELDEMQQKRFLDALRPCFFKAGTLIVRQGDAAEDGFYIITDGEVTVTRMLTPAEAATAPPSLLING
ncbi:cyclic nucleotide-binding domain-containing protein, partial [archaeon]